MNSLFVSGIYRSGTTLLQRLLNQHKDILIADQPFPSFYFFIKDKFNEKINYQTIYPIHPDFPRKYSYTDLNNFLEEFILNKKDIQNIFGQLKNYSGCHTPEASLIPLPKEGYFYDVLMDLHTAMSHFLKPSSLYHGSKEILIEEFCPLFLRKNSKVILIIRDPRDVISSLNFGQGNKYTGSIRPLLYSLRLWRKSVAYYIVLKNNPGFMCVRYEDLVSSPDIVLQDIFEFLDLPNQPISLSDWEGNSSYGKLNEVNPSSVGSYKKYLSEDTISYIDSICRPEMVYMNYIGQDQKVKDLSEFINFEESPKPDHSRFSENFSGNSLEIMEEVKRAKLLKEAAGENEILEYYLFHEVYETLRLNYIK